MQIPVETFIYGQSLLQAMESYVGDINTIKHNLSLVRSKIKPNMISQLVRYTEDTNLLISDEKKNLVKFIGDQLSKR